MSGRTKAPGLQFRMNGFVACAGQAREALINLDVRIADSEVGQVIITGQPGRHGVRDFVGLGREVLTLHEAAEWFCVSEVFFQ